MKPLVRTLSFAAVVAAAAPVLAHAQSDRYGPPPAPPPGDSSQQMDQLSPMDQLVSSIALYPDPIVALILPAATEPDQVRDAARFAEERRDPRDVDQQNWAPAVKGLAHYPDLTRWLAENGDWTREIGAAYATRPHEVMAAIQELRHRAIDAGTLVSRDQEQVVQDDGIVQIVPTQDNTIFIPRYDPATVYFRGTPGPHFAWGEPRAAGPWLAYYPDWRDREVWTGDWLAYRRGGGASRQIRLGNFGISFNGGGDRDRDRGHPFHVSDGSPVLRERFSFDDRRGLARPHPMYGAPGYDRDRRQTFDGDRRDRRYDDHDRRYDDRRDDDRDRGYDDRDRR